jgi:hypothetical protein
VVPDQIGGLLVLFLKHQLVFLGSDFVFLVELVEVEAVGVGALVVPQEVGAVLGGPEGDFEGLGIEGKPIEYLPRARVTVVAMAAPRLRV